MNGQHRNDPVHPRQSELDLNVQPTGLAKQTVLRNMTFGQRIAEEEARELAAYFVDTEHWRKIFAGEVDIVYGSKGSGKSALYFELQNRQRQLNERHITLVAAENPRGNTVFHGLVEDPPTSEHEFIYLWKLYFLSLAARILREQRIPGELSDKVTSELECAGLLPRDNDLPALLRSVIDYIRPSLHLEAAEGGIKLDPHTGLPSGLTGKITFREPSRANREKGLVSVDSLLAACDKALRDAASTVWLALDRLDVAFADSQTLEANALRALFRVYRDMAGFDNIRLKIFLRNDIWERITVGGFREGSHFIRTITIQWDESTLLNLAIRRILKNDSIRERYDVEERNVLADFVAQEGLFYRIFPQQIEAGARKPQTFKWMLSRTSDGTGRTAPRELIHLLSAARDEQLRRLEIGGDEPQGELLFTARAIKDALPLVSNERINQTLFAEYPETREWLIRLRGDHTHQTIDSLSRIWNIDAAEAQKRASTLVDIGFFEQPTSAIPPIYRVPALYRSALNLVQGAAD